MHAVGFAIAVGIKIRFYPEFFFNPRFFVAKSTHDLRLAFTENGLWGVVLGMTRIHAYAAQNNYN
jgi:hypothetical protein